RQRSSTEDISSLIEDPWRTFKCPKEQLVCRVEFEDTEFKRDSVYYVRALEEPTPMVNAKNLRARFDESGSALAVTPCRMDFRTAADDDCLGMAQQRAWSSPIYVNASNRP